MQRLWLAGGIRDLWEECVRERMYTCPQGNLVVATQEQKQAVKDWILYERGGLAGWNILTEAEARRRLAQVGTQELEWLAKIRLRPESWAEVSLWAKGLMRCVQAGYAPEEMPWRSKIWRELTESIVKLLKKEKLRLTAEVDLRADVVMGMDPLDFFHCQAEVVAMVCEGEISAPQMTSIEYLESIYGEKTWCQAGDEGIQIKNTESQQRCVRVANATEALRAIEEIITQEEGIGKIERVVGQGALARAWAAEMAQKTSTQHRWINTVNKESVEESTRLMLWAKNANYEAEPADTLEALRQQIVEGRKPASEHENMRDEIIREWIKSGCRRWTPAQELPPQATVDTYARLTVEVFPKRTEQAKRKLEGWQRFSPNGMVPRELWIEVVTQKKKETGLCGGVRVVDWDEALGLVDRRTLVVWVEPPKEAAESPWETRIAAEWNRAQYEEGNQPSKGYLRVNDCAQAAAREQQAVDNSLWVMIENTGAPEGVQAQRKNYKTFKSYNNENINESLAQEGEELKAKHALRSCAAQPMGEYDYAVPAPVRASCKQWEYIVTTPELAWYEVLNLKPLWMAKEAPPAALAVGTWVHAALKDCVTQEQVNGYFAEKVNTPAGSMEWKKEVMVAWEMALGFAKGLENTETVRVEYPLKGAVGRAWMTGRVDRIIKDEQGKEIIIDFKTGKAGPVCVKNIEEGDGLQLWLYGRLWGKEVGLCRWSPGGKLKNQETVTAERLEVEKLIDQMVCTGVFGQKGWLWGRFGGQERLPLAALPQDWKQQYARRKEICANYENNPRPN